MVGEDVSNLENMRWGGHSTLAADIDNRLAAYYYIIRGDGGVRQSVLIAYCAGSQLQEGLEGPVGLLEL